MVREVTGYETSKDYHRLFELAQQQSIICLCQWHKEMMDIAQTIFDVDARYFSVSARGTGYITANNIGEFVRQCKQCDLEWISPNNATGERL